MSNYLQMPYQDIIGENSLVQKALKYLRVFADEKPMPNANTTQSRSASALILTHLLALCDGTGLINCRGYHSAAITMFRPIEDATDCFAAVALDTNAAKKWGEGKLKRSANAERFGPAFLFLFSTRFRRQPLWIVWNALILRM